MTIANFTPGSALLGGTIIGLGAAVLWWANGRLAGISNIAGQVFVTSGDERLWRLCFLAGLIVAGTGAAFAVPESVSFELKAGYGQIILAGLLVGYGTQLGSGCTSGHGICGIGRLSPRSIVATLCFVGAGMLAVAGLRLAGLL
ncbi:MAG: YeeE/YedE family protein [Burkholderiales bacterium]